METLQGLFAEKLVEDHREPLATFDIPGLEGQYALLAPRGALWYQLMLSIVVQLGFQMIFAVAIYHLIIKQLRGSTASYLLGYGIIIPLAAYIPFRLVDYWQVHNGNVRLAFGTMPMIVCFRCIEAMHDTSPPVVETNLGTYMVYYTTVSHFEWDATTAKRRKITAQEVRQTLLRLVFIFTSVSLCLSFMMHVNYQPMASSNVALDGFVLSWELLSPSHLINTYCLAILTYFVLATGFEITTFGEQIKGYATKPIFDNPLFSSRSIREFWGRKWDLMIHRVLKHGAYLPARNAFGGGGNGNNGSGNNKDSKIGNLAGTVAAFLASGILHEYCWALIFAHGRGLGGGNGGDDSSFSCARSDGNCYYPAHLKLTCFFLYCGLTMLIEHFYGRHVTFFEKWPTVIVSTMLVFTAVPLSHWYTGDWVVGGFFSDFSIGLWTIRKL